MDTLCLYLPLPDHKLTINGRKKHGRTRAGHAAIARIEAEHKDDATRVAGQALLDKPWPYFPKGTQLKVNLAIKKASKRSKAWYRSAVIEAMKPYMDAMNGIVYDDDVALHWGEVSWEGVYAEPGWMAVSFIPLEPAEAPYMVEHTPPPANPLPGQLALRLRALADYYDDSEWRREVRALADELEEASDGLG